jgi:hypothetical protein
VRLSEIARSLGEATSLKKTIERLGRQLERRGLRQQVQDDLLALAAPRITSKSHRAALEILDRVGRAEGSMERVAGG